MNPAGEWAALLLDALAHGGVRDVVISPGSRSTALVHAAVRHPRLRCFDVIDERSAAFHALGRAKVQGLPVLLICTSGTAPAHYLPAVIEASESYTPLVVLSADRPLSLQGCGASQTIDQVKLFGDHVRLFADLGVPDPRAASLRALRRTALRAVHASRYPTPGPVHLDARAETPLEPARPADAPEREAEAVARGVAAEPLTHVHLPRVLPSERTTRELADALSRAASGLIVCGPAPLARSADRSLVFELARRTGFALLAEASSQMRFAGSQRAGVVSLDGFDAVLRSPSARASVRPDLILQVGAGPVSAGYGSWLASHPPPRRVVLCPHRFDDPPGTATDLVPSEVGPTLESVLSRLPAGPRSSPLGERLAAAERAVRRVAQVLLDASPNLGEAATARTLVGSLPPGALLALGNSLPLRTVDAWVEGEAADVRVLSQRGAAGIDGLISGAAGAARAAAAPTALLLGDVSFAHDLGGLATAGDMERPFAVVVVRNGGGRIFEGLPLAARMRPAVPLEHWTTPPSIAIERAAALFDHAFERADSPARLAEAMARALDRPGCTVVEALVPPHGAAEETRGLLAGVHEALAGVW